MTDALEEEIVLKLLHTADWHLGRRFRQFGDDGQRKLSRARLDVLERILLAAERHAVDAVLCAGDLFDEPNPPREWWAEVAKCFQKRRWSERQVFLLPGNHDPLTEESIWTKPQFRSELPNFVHVVDRPSMEFSLPNDAVLYAVPCLSKAGQNDPTGAIPPRAPSDSRIRIGMVHGSTFDMKDCQTHFPIDRDAALRCGLDYLAIGDTHGFRFVPPERKVPPTVYPGAPEPTAFDEEDAGSVAIVFFGRQRRAIVERERVAAWRWEEVTVKAPEDLRRLAARTDLGDRVLRLHVEMRVSAEEYDLAERLLVELEGTDAAHGRVGVLDLDRTGLELDVASIGTQFEELPAVLKAAAAKLKAAAEDPLQRAVAERALYHLFRMSRKAS